MIKSVFVTLIIFAFFSHCQSDDSDPIGPILKIYEGEIDETHSATPMNILFQMISGIGGGLLLGYGTFAVYENSCDQYDDRYEIKSRCSMNPYFAVPIAYSIGNFGGTLVASKLLKINGDVPTQILGQVLGSAIGFGAAVAMFGLANIHDVKYPLAAWGLCINLGGVVGYDFFLRTGTDNNEIIGLNQKLEFGIRKTL